MLNLNKELESLKGLGDILKTAIEKTEREINENAPKEGATVLNFIDELKEVMATGKGIEELQEKIKNYENNR